MSPEVLTVPTTIEPLSSSYVDGLPEANIEGLLVTRVTYHDRTWSHSNPCRVRRTLDALAVADVAAPAHAVEALDRCHSIAPPPGALDPRPAMRRKIARRMAAGELSADDAAAELADIDTDEALAQRNREMTASLEHARIDAYAESVAVIREHGDQLLGDLRDALGEVLAAQLDFSDAVSNPIQVARYGAIHDAAQRLRHLGAIDSVENLPAHYSTRFANPLAVHQWRLDRATEARLITRTDRRPDGTTTVWRTVARGPSPELHTAANHADNWQPCVPTAAEIVATLDRQYAIDTGAA